MKEGVADCGSKQFRRQRRCEAFFGNRARALRAAASPMSPASPPVREPQRPDVRLGRLYKDPEQRARVRRRGDKVADESMCSAQFDMPCIRAAVDDHGTDGRFLRVAEWQPHKTELAAKLLARLLRPCSRRAGGNQARRKQRILYIPPAVPRLARLGALPGNLCCSNHSRIVPQRAGLRPELRLLRVSQATGFPRPKKRLLSPSSGGAYDKSEDNSECAVKSSVHEENAGGW